MARNDTARGIIGTYLATSVLFTLSTSIIWAVNTLFLLHAGLSIFEVFLVNAAFSIGDVIFQVPTGVLADTLGRKVSFMLSLATLTFSTLAYVAAAQYHLGIWVFALASVFLGLGFTFYTGAVEAWLVDALDRVGYAGTRERVFAWGGMSFSAAMLVGTLAGGLLGQIDLSLPYVVRSALLAITFVLVAFFMHEVREERPPLSAMAFAKASRRVFVDGVRYVWDNRVIRPLVLVSFFQGLFFIYGFYSWQRYFLDVLGTEAIWLVGVVSALFGVAGIAGNALVGRVTRNGTRPAAPILARLAIIQAVLVTTIGLVGIFLPKSARGVVPFVVLVTLYALFGSLFGVFSPIRQAFINPYIRPQERATVLSVDTMFSDVGGTLGGPALGYVSQALSIPVAWAIGGIFLAVGYPFYRQAASAAEEPGAKPDRATG